jgi:hypothetical protein
MKNDLTLAVPHQRQRTADRGFRRDVQHDGAERRAAHPRIGNPHHVLDAGARELSRDRQIAGLRHARRALRAGIAQHQHVVGGDVEIGIVDPQRHVLDGFEHHGAAGVLQQFRARRRMLDHGAARREIAVQHRHRAFRLDRIVRGRIASWPGTSSAPATTSRSVAPVMVWRRDRSDRRAAPSVSARRRHDGNAPCNARPTASGRSAPAPRGRACRRLRDRCDAGAVGDRGQMDEPVGRAADRLQHDLRIAERGRRSGLARARAPSPWPSRRPCRWPRPSESARHAAPGSSRSSAATGPAPR